jgi:hypothetical protein
VPGHPSSLNPANEGGQANSWVIRIVRSMPSAPLLGAATPAGSAAVVPAEVVSERLGHANVAIAMDTYSRCSGVG